MNRSETPWLIVLMHCPIYNSKGNAGRAVYESWFVKYKVDIVLSGHIHAYERSVNKASDPPLICTHY